MFTKSNKNIKTIFLDQNSSENMPDERVNVILSPSLYWVKKLTLPVKTVREAKKLLASIFEDTLPEGNYNYYVYKQNDQFFAFAYEDKIILDLLSEKGISDSNIQNVYFSQSELAFIDGTVKINETQKICLKNGLLIMLCPWVENAENLNLDNVKLSSNFIILAKFGHIVDNKSLYSIGILLFMLILLVTTEYFVTYQKLSELTILKDKIFKDYHLESTLIQNRAILKKYKSIHTKQNKIREYISIILYSNLGSSEELKQISFKNSRLVVEFNSLSQKSIDNISKNLKSNSVKYKLNKKEKSLYLEMIL